jgi:hypothetical protein
MQNRCNGFSVVMRSMNDRYECAVNVVGRRECGGTNLSKLVNNPGRRFRDPGWREPPPTVSESEQAVADGD